MSPELKYLALTALLTASLWIPYVVAQVVTNGPLKPANSCRSDAAPAAALGSAREPPLHQCSETFAPFAAIVILVQLAGKNDSMTAFWTMSYFWLRLAHAIVFLVAIPYIRTIIFVLGYVCIIGLFVELMK